MISKTTKPNEHGWYYTFRKRKDNTIIIEKKNKKHKFNDSIVYVYDENYENHVIKAFLKVVNHKFS